MTPARGPGEASKVDSWVSRVVVSRNNVDARPRLMMRVPNKLQRRLNSGLKQGQDGLEDPCDSGLVDLQGLKNNLTGEGDLRKFRF